MVKEMESNSAFQLKTEQFYNNCGLSEPTTNYRNKDYKNDEVLHRPAH